MSESKATSTPLDQAWAIGLALFLPLLAMSLRGVDASWDLRNYHLYNAHAWLSGRMSIDVAPAQIQSFHNPLLDVPLYLIVHSGAAARWASAWLTLPCIASIYFILRLQLSLSITFPSPLSQGVLALLALTGAAMYSTLGLSTNDAFVAAATLGSLLLVVGGNEAGGKHHRWLCAGLVMGAMAGLKLTAAIYCVGLAAAALVQGDWANRVRCLGRLALGGLLGFVATYGYWGWRLFSEHGNPFFPYYNNIFRSPDAWPISWADTRFRPDTLLDAVLAPVHLLSRSVRFSELRMNDPRLLLGLVGLGALLALAWRKHPSFREKFAFLFVFFVASFLCWVLQYGIYRYAIALELLGALALVLLLDRLPRQRRLTMFVAFLLVSADTHRPNWGHSREVPPMAGIRAPPLGSDALVVTANDDPVAYLALGLPDTIPLIAVNNNFMSPERGTPLQLRAEQKIANHTGPIWLLAIDGSGLEKAQKVLSGAFGLEPMAPCIAYPNALAPALLCLERHRVPAKP